AGLAGDGTVGLHVSGTYNGQPISQVAHVRLAPYTVSFSAPPTTIGVGVTVTASISLSPQTAYPAGWNYLQGQPRPAAFADLQLQSSNSDLLQAQVGATRLSYPLTLLQPGTATASFPPSA